MAPTSYPDKLFIFLKMNCPIRILNDNDADSLRSGDGSNADSGHGPSEEGESNANAVRPFPSATDNHDNPVQVGM